MIETAMPHAMSYGVSYHDYWDMTFGEIKVFLKFADKKADIESREKLQLAAFTAYHSALYVRVKKFPDSMSGAFPTLFDRTETGGVPADDVQRSKATLQRCLSRFSQAFPHA